MAAIRRHLPLITARVEFSKEVITGHPSVTHAIDFGYVTERRALSPIFRRSLSPVMADDDPDDNSDAGASPSTWIDYDDEDVDMVTAGAAERRTGGTNEAGPSASPVAGRASGKKIPKPSGEAGRPNCGGYNLERKLKWEKEVFEEIKVGDFYYSHITLIIDSWY